MHSTIISFNDSPLTQKDTKYSEDTIYEMMSKERKLDGVKEITEACDFQNILTYFIKNGYIYQRQVEVKPDGIMIL